MCQFVDITWVCRGKEEQLEKKHMKQRSVRKGPWVSLQLQTKLGTNKASVTVKEINTAGQKSSPQCSNKLFVELEVSHCPLKVLTIQMKNALEEYLELHRGRKWLSCISNWQQNLAALITTYWFLQTCKMPEWGDHGILKPRFVWQGCLSCKEVPEAIIQSYEGKASRNGGDRMFGMLGLWNVHQGKLQVWRRISY